MKRPEKEIAHRLNAQFGAASPQVILAQALKEYRTRITLVSSFGAEAAVLLHMLAQIDRDIPVMMIDTKLLFAQTLEYQESLSQYLGLRDVRVIRASDRHDPERSLHKSDTLGCCALRKVEPLEQALKGFDAVITGRKRYQSSSRKTIKAFERDPHGRLKISPLLHWKPDQIQTYFEVHDLPRHPLVAQGYPSIGCAPCTSPVAPGESPRAGRWRSESREECGIHFNPDGTIERKAG